MSTDDREDPTGGNKPEYVGYGFPPKKSRFEKGNVAHLKSRKQPKADLSEITDRFVVGSVPYRDGRKRRRASRIDVQLKKYERRALTGDLTAIAALIDMREDKAMVFQDLHKVTLYFEEEDADC